MQNAIEAGNAKAALAKQATGGYSERQVQELETMQLAQQANALAEMEQSYNASQRQLLAELDAMRQRQAAANERAKRADYMVRCVKSFSPRLWDYPKRMTMLSNCYAHSVSQEMPYRRCWWSTE